MLLKWSGNTQLSCSHVTTVGKLFTYAPQLLHPVSSEIWYQPEDRKGNISSDNTPIMNHTHLSAHCLEKRDEHSAYAPLTAHSVIFVNENENENGEKRENNEFVNEN